MTMAAMAQPTAAANAMDTRAIPRAKSTSPKRAPERPDRQSHSPPHGSRREIRMTPTRATSPPAVAMEATTRCVLCIGSPPGSIVLRWIATRQGSTGPSSPSEGMTRTRTGRDGLRSGHGPSSRYRCHRAAPVPCHRGRSGQDGQDHHRAALLLNVMDGYTQAEIEEPAVARDGAPPSANLPGRGGGSDRTHSGTGAHARHRTRH